MVVSFARVAKVVAFIHDYQTEIAHIVDIHHLRHRHDFRFEVVFPDILAPHLLKIGRANNQGAGGISHFINLGNGTGCNGLAETHHITNHCTASSVVVKMTGDYLDCVLLEIEKLSLEYRRQCKLLYSITCLFAEVVSYFEINMVRRNQFFGRPTFVYGFDKFLGNIHAETVVPAVIEPCIEFLGLVTVAKFGIEFPLLGKPGISEVAAAHYRLNGIRAVFGTMCKIQFSVKRLTDRKFHHHFLGFELC